MLPNKTEALQDTAYNVARDTGRKARDIINDATHNARDTIAATEKQIREYPITSAAVAAGVGFLLGSLFRR